MNGDSNWHLPPDLAMGAIRLRVASLDRALAFYEGLLDLSVVQTSAEHVALAARADLNPLIHLVQQPGIRHRPEGTPGLYHFALLYPDRRDLGRTLLRLFEQRLPFQGFADHGVSEAAYLADPDGNGIELAADRPRAQWKRDDGEIVMGTQVLNVTALLRAVDGDPWIGPPAATRIGHVHLHVSDLDAATRFYADVFGFTITSRRFPGATFLASGSYHHHVAVNTWAKNARPADDEMAGMVEFAVGLADASTREALSARLAAAGAPLEECDGGFLTADTDGNRIRVESS